MVEKTYAIGDIIYTIYIAASGDYCVTVSEYGKEDKSYNLGSEVNALKFILSEYEYPDIEE